jgi:hypothetical protein
MNMKPIKKTGPFSRVFHITMADPWDLAMMFLRMQEWYESPKFHHKHFTIEQYMKWYQKAYGKGNFTYPTDWSGFNVPSDAVLAIMNGPVGGFVVEADLFLKLCRVRHYDGKPLVDTPDPSLRRNNWCDYRAPYPFYLIGTTEKYDADTLDHEIAHGHFFVDPVYRRRVRACLRRHDTSSLEKFLLNMGYSVWTLTDEIHAYALTGWPDGFKTNADLRCLHYELVKIAGEHQP